VQFLTDMLKPPLRRCYPVPISPRGIVPDVLLMPTLKVSNPVEGFV